MNNRNNSPNNDELTPLEDMESTESSFWDSVNSERVEVFSMLVRSLIGGFIGFSLTLLFVLVVLVIVLTALFGNPDYSESLLNTALTIAGPPFGAVFGYFLCISAKKELH